MSRSSLPVNNTTQVVSLERCISNMSALALVLLFVFNKSVYKIPYLEWAFGVLCVFLLVLSFVIKAKVPTLFLKLIVISTLWCGYALMVTPFSFNSAHHIKWLSLSVVLAALAAGLVFSVFSQGRCFLHKASGFIIFSWLIPNLTLFVLWLLGLYTFEKIDFSGVMFNRNDFAVQTVIIMTFYLFFSKDAVGRKYVLIGLSSLLILSSLSVKGFCLALIVLFYPWYLKSSFGRKLAIIFMMIASAATIYLAVEPIQQRIDRFALSIAGKDDELRSSESAYVRKWFVIEGIRHVASNPLTGVGVDNARYFLIPDYIYDKGLEEEGMYSHNNYIEMGMNAGLPGLMLYYLPLVYMFFRVRRGGCII